MFLSTHRTKRLNHRSGDYTQLRYLARYHWGHATEYSVICLDKLLLSNVTIGDSINPRVYIYIHDGVSDMFLCHGHLSQCSWLLLCIAKIIWSKLYKYHGSWCPNSMYVPVISSILFLHISTLFGKLCCCTNDIFSTSFRNYGHLYVALNIFGMF